MTQPYLFGFPSSVKAISFPGRPRILTAEVQGITPNTGNYTFNGEPFEFFANPPVGPANKINGIALVPGVPGPLGLPTFMPPAPAPTIVSPFSTDMKNRLYAWEQPVPGFISSNQTTGAAILFLDLDNVEKVFNNPKSFQFNIQTTSHGTSTPPGPPETIWFIYYDPLGESPSNAASVSATQNFSTQSFLDITVNLETMQYWIQDRTVAANPVAVSNYGFTRFNICSMYNYIGQQAGYPLMPLNLPLGFSTQALANEMVDYCNTAGPPPAIPGSENWNPVGEFFNPTMTVFPWLVAPAPPPGSAACSWSMKVRTWWRATQFTINTNGTLGDVSIVGPKGELFPVKPIQTTTAISRGANDPACANIISVLPASMKFNLTQRFS